MNLYASGPRSYLLAKLPEARTDGRASRVTRRTLTAAVVLFALGLLLATVAFRLLPRTGPAYILYWLHDSVYLPIKGYTFSLFFPESLVWWMSGLTVIILWTLWWVTDRSLVREPHILLLRVAVYQPLLHGVLLISAQILTRFNIEPVLLRQVVNLERRRVLHQLMQDVANPSSREHPAESADHTNALVNLTILQIGLLFLSAQPPTTEPHVHAALIWYDAYFFVWKSGDRRTQRSLAKDFIHILRINPSDTWLEDGKTATDIFSAQNLLVDLAYLVLFLDPEASDTWKRTDGSVFVAPTTATINQHLVDSLRQRIAQVREWHTVVRPSWRNRQTSSFANSAEPIDKWSSIEASWCGQMALTIGLHSSELAGISDAGLSLYDSINTLKLALTLSSQQPASQTDLRNYLIDLFGETPRPFDNVFCAMFLESHQSERNREWRQSQFSKDTDPLIKNDDFVWGKLQIESYRRSAGPHFQTKQPSEQ